MLVAGDVRRTWKDQYERSCRVARALEREGVAKGDRIAFLDRNGLEYFDVIFGGSFLGAVSVAVNWRLAPPEMGAVIDDMIVTGAENVYPAEVENALLAHPSVVDAAVIGVPDERWGEAVKAIVVLAPGVTWPAAEAAAELIAFCRDRLAGYKCPKTVDLAETLPRNPSGKILKRELRAPYWEGRERQIG